MEVMTMKINRTKSVLVAMILCTSMGAQAQWATFNVSDALYDYFRSMRDYVTNSNLQAISNGQQLQMAQASQNFFNTDYRNRTAMMASNILQEDDKTRPTYALCVEASKGQVGVSSLAASRSTGGAGGRAPGAKPDPKTHYKPTDTYTIQENLRSDENISGMILNNIKSTGTCATRYGDICGSADGQYALADVSVFGLLSNSDRNKVKKDAAGNKLDVSNYTMDSGAYDAGAQYINVATLANAPKLPTKEQMGTNVAYISKYNAVITKLNAAADTFRNMLDLRSAPTVVNSSVKSVWASNTADWEEVFPKLNRPEVPSFYDFMNFRIMADVFGTKTLASSVSGSDSETLKGIQMKIAMNNLISWKQYNQQERTNILLSHILVQLTTPASKLDLDAEYKKMNDAK
jgi:hypothetical protein